MIQEMTFPLGVCPTHGPKLAVNGVPTCIKCKAKEDNAGRVLQMVQVEDPGEAYFKGQGLVGKAEAPKPVVSTKTTQETSAVYDMQTGLQDILNILARIPMPTSMKQYKLLMNVKQKIETALQEG